MLNFPIVTKAAYEFWSSRNRCNRVRAICAFSLDKENALMNLQRAAYPLGYRQRVVDSKGISFNNPSMAGVPYNDGSVPMWDCLQSNTNPTLGYWDDSDVWVDSSSWK